MGTMSGAKPGSAAGLKWVRLLTLGIFLVLTLILASGQASSSGTAATPPLTLAETGLYSDAGALVVDPRHLAFSPQYPLWTDGATKSRWLSLPPATAIDGSDADAWKFPVGTRIWKEFSFGGRRIETRYMELQADGQWLYAAYEWSEDGKQAILAPEGGRRGAFSLGEKQSHTIPGRIDCKVCHQGGPSEVLGFSALQLSAIRDPAALHAVNQDGAKTDLGYLLKHGLITGLDEDVSAIAPRITAASETERVALGYLHGNCGHCHNSRGSLANLGLFLKQELQLPERTVVDSLFAQPVRKRAPGQSPEAMLRIDPGHAEHSALLERVSSRYPALQMPPLGTVLVDEQAVALISRWISEIEAQHQGSN